MSPTSPRARAPNCEFDLKLDINNLKNEIVDLKQNINKLKHVIIQWEKQSRQQSSSSSNAFEKVDVASVARGGEVNTSVGSGERGT